MMFKQVKDILDVIKQFHEKLNQYYKNLAIKSDKDRVKILLDYVHKNQANLIESIEKYKSDGNETFLQIWIRHTPHSHFNTDVETIQLENDMSIDDVVEVVLHFNSWLENFYQYILETSNSKQVKQTFSILLDNLKNEKLNMVKDSKILEDI